MLEFKWPIFAQQQSQVSDFTSKKWAEAKKTLEGYLLFDYTFEKTNNFKIWEKSIIGFMCISLSAYHNVWHGFTLLIFRLGLFEVGRKSIIFSLTENKPIVDFFQKSFVNID